MIQGLRRWQIRLKETKGGESRAFAELACGKLSASPCKAEAESTGIAIDNILADKGLDPRRRESDRVSLINFRRMGAALKLMGDPDCDFLADIAADGVAIGVDVELPRIPVVFEEKVKWKLEADETDTAEYWGENYKSAAENMGDIRRQIVEDVQSGAAIRMSVSEARKRYGGKLTI